jgi:tRNA pseudouridine32 synthase/23S rRNA pseudouridine746 synthase
MLIPFKQHIDRLPIPEKLNYPFYYQSDPLCLIAAKQLQDLIKKNEWDHNFGLSTQNQSLAIGKMFGVLVVKDKDENLFFLAAYSGKLQGKNPDHFFVPNLMRQDKNFDVEKNKVLIISKAIEEIEKELNTLTYLVDECEQELSTFRLQMVEAKKQRKYKRENNLLDEKLLVKESLHYKFLHKELKKNSIEKLKPLERLQVQRDNLIKKRKTILQKVQKLQFEQYTFLNARLEKKDLNTIFLGLPYKPPTGSGDCAAPKLLHFAYSNQLTPVSIAEFWWGASPKGEVRRHKTFYPACTSRCGPILSHMLQGLNVETNPMLINTGENKEVEIIFEDDALIVINKPEGLLSVPGKNIKDSVAARFDTALIVHRLDQETSGLMILAKDSESQKELQKQFIAKTIRKKYSAILEGRNLPCSGTIDLPLILDFNNRPRQKVCYNTGKPSLTEFEVQKTKGNYALVTFYPRTGRTHQLRIHSAHFRGLNSPIKGDTLYGTKNDRLYLHAESVSFSHPKTSEKLNFECDSGFNI